MLLLRTLSSFDSKKAKSMNRTIDELAKQYVKKTVTLGNYSEGKEYLKAIEQHNVDNLYIGVDETSEEFLQSAHFDTNQKEITLVFLSLEALGFSASEDSAGPTYDQIRLAGLSQGLELCPPEVGPALRLQFIDQDDQSGTNPLATIFVITEPIHAKETFCFRVSTNSHDGFLSLSARIISPGQPFNPDLLSRFAFVLHAL